MNLLDHLLEAAHEVGGIAQPRRRAAVERWLLEFSAVNVQLNALQAMVVAEQLARRYGYWAIVDERSWDRLIRVPLRTELEWSFAGMWPADFARPLAVPGSHGDEVVLFLPEDVPGAALDERIVAPGQTAAWRTSRSMLRWMCSRPSVTFTARSAASPGESSES